MNGYQLAFFMPQGRRHAHQPLADWLLSEARHLGIRGATVFGASEGYGHHGRIHSARFFELSDQPQEVVMAVTEEEAERIFARLREEQIHVFYVKTPIEFGTLGEAES